MEFNNLKAAMLVVIAMTMITTNDAIVKHITQVFGIGQIMFMRGLLICVIFAVVLKFKKQPVLDRASVNRWSLVRACLELLATLTFLTGLSLLPIATASTLGFASPLFLAILAAVFLGERVGLLRWLIIVAGFGGVILITNPFSGEMNWAVIFPITCAVFVALRDMVIRYVPPGISTHQVAFTNAWVVTLGGGIYSLFQGWNVAELSWYLWFIALSITMYCGYLFYISGSRLGELSYIGPFKYVSILIAIGYGYLLWDELPSPTMLIGAAIIIFSGVILIYGEKRKARLAAYPRVSMRH